MKVFALAGVVVVELEQPDVELHLRATDPPIAFWLTSDGDLLGFVEVGRA